MINDHTLIKMFAFIVNRMQKRVVNDDGEIQYADRFLFVKLIACRTKQPQIISFKHRFKDDNDMALIDDIHLPRAISTSTESEFIKERTATGQKPSGSRRIVG